MQIGFFQYRKNSIDRPGGTLFFSTHNFRTNVHRTNIKSYSDRKVSTLSKYVFIFVLFRNIQKLCVDKKVDTLWSIYRDFTVCFLSIFNHLNSINFLFFKFYNSIKHFRLYFFIKKPLYIQ